jgi:hypothetical protein
VNPRVQHAHSLRETLLSFLDRSKGSQRAPRGGESLVVRVNGYRSILNAYDAGKEAIWIHLGFRRRRVASYLTPDTTRRCESIIPFGCEQPALRVLAKGYEEVSGWDFGGSFIRNIVGVPEMTII